MNFKEEIDKMKKEIEETSDSSKSLFREILHDYKIANKRIFIICIIETITINRQHINTNGNMQKPNICKII